MKYFYCFQIYGEWAPRGCTPYIHKYFSNAIEMREVKENNLSWV